MPAISRPMRNRENFKHDSEFKVYERLLYGLDAGWIIIPGIELLLPNSFKEREADILLVHPEHGMILIEVKSSFAVRDGEFYKIREDKKLDKDPTRQLQAQREVLSELLLHIDRDVYNKIRRVVASPATVQSTGSLPAGYRTVQILDSGKLANIPRWINELCSIEKGSAFLGEHAFKLILDELCPSADFDNTVEGLRSIAHAQLEQRMMLETQVLESLDLNNRAIVTGGAGSGKSRLVLAWAQRALRRGERVLVTCYNDPLAIDLQEQLNYEEGELTVAPILRHLEYQLGLEWREPEENEDLSPYWESMTQLCFTSSGSFAEQFDTIIVDEAQDFDERWIAVLERLLPPKGKGNGKILMVGDPYQDVRGTGARLPTNDEGWAMAELTANYRNSPHIADFMKRRFQGAGAAADSFPLHDSIKKAHVTDLDQMTSIVDQLLEKSQRAAADIWILTTSRIERDHLREVMGLRAWDEEGSTVVCETVRRLKGLDIPEVILISLKPIKDEQEHLRLLYAGISRAIDKLAIIGSTETLSLLAI